jgi:transcription elongation factor GreA
MTLQFFLAALLVVVYCSGMVTFPITPAGLEKLRSELQRLKIERPKISQEIGRAREMGDLSENFEYHAAKDRQGLLEARIRDLEDKLARAQVIDPKTLSGERVVFGATVVIEDTDSGEKQTYTIVGEEESVVESGRISVSSPLARALIGKSVGDEAKIPSRNGPRTVEIADVTFG